LTFPFRAGGINAIPINVLSAPDKTCATSEDSFSTNRNELCDEILDCTRLELVARAVEQSGTCLLITDTSGVIEYVSPAVESLTGFSSAELVGKTPRIFQSGLHTPEFYEDLWKTITSGRVWRGQFHNCRKNGELYWELATISPVLDEQGCCVNFIGVKEEITEIKVIEKRLRVALEEAERSARAKSQFLANMSHEIRTPMNAVIGMTHLLLDCELGDEQREYVEIVRDSADALLNILNDILDYSKIEAGRLQLEETEFCLGTLLNDCTRLMAPRAQEKEIEFIHDISSDIPAALWGDPSRLRQILLNLIGNAVKFTPSGEISVHIQIAEQASQTLTLEFCVRDTGAGIPEEQLGQLFKKFEQGGAQTSRTHGGTGLGLAISKALVEAMGGSIHVQSRESEGSTFRFLIPFKKWSEDAVNLPCKAKFNAVSLAGLCPRSGNLLLVEDNATSRQVAARMLVRMGHRVHTAANGEEALRFLSENTVDMILMDLRMPGLNGLETTAKIRDGSAGARQPLIPIVAMTAHAFTEDRQKCFDAGMNDYVAKPVLPAQLATVLNRWLPVPLPVGNGEKQSDGTGNGTSRSHAMHAEDTILVVDDDLITQQVLGKLLHSLGYKAAFASNAHEAIEILPTLENSWPCSWIGPCRGWMASLR
jgi:PAS domain S-box-containing protein